MRLLSAFVFANLATVAWSRSVGPWGTPTAAQSAMKSVLSIPAGGSLDSAKSAAIQGAADKVHITYEFLCYSPRSQCENRIFVPAY